MTLAAPPRATLPDGNVRLSDGRVLIDRGGFGHGAHWRTRDGLLVIASMDPTPHGLLLHVSMSYSNRNPKWAEIRAVRDAFFPSTVDCMMVLPRAEDYVNIHAHTFHIWQTPAAWGVL